MASAKITPSAANATIDHQRPRPQVRAREHEQAETTALAVEA